MTDVTFKPTLPRQLVRGFLTLPGITVIFWVSFLCVSQGISQAQPAILFIGLLFFCVALGCLLLLAFHVSGIVHIENQTIIRHWLFGSRQIPVDAITLMYIGRRSSSLLLECGRKTYALPLSLGKKQRLDIVRIVMEIRGLANELDNAPSKRQWNLEPPTSVTHR